MDPLSITASITGILAFTFKVMSIGYTLHSRTRNHVKDLDSLITEVTLLSGLLGGIQELVRQPGANLNTSSRTVRECIQRGLWDCQASMRDILELFETLKDASKLSLLLRGESQKDRIGVLAQQIRQHKTLFILCFQLNQGAQSEEIGTRIQTVLDELRTMQQSQAIMQDLLESSQKAIAAERQKQMMTWLGPSSESEHEDICKRRSQDKDACKWILLRSEYTSWQESEVTCFLWLKGIQGCGKSVITSKIIETIQTTKVEANRDGNTALVYHYCSFASKLSLSLDQVMASLVYQLLSQLPASSSGQALTGIENLYNKAQRSGSRPKADQLKSIFLDTCSHYREIYVVIDGLDEIADHMDAIALLETLSTAASNFKVFIASRPEFDVREHLPGCLTITLTPQDVSRDIQHYVRHKLDKLRLRIPNPEEKIQLLDELVSRADGMFLWAVCQLSYLSEIRIPVTVDTLENLPGDLENTFEAIFLRMNKWDRAQAATILRFIIYSENPMSIQELLEGIAATDDVQNLKQLHRKKLQTSDIHAICGSLVRESSATGTISLSHYSVQEYLTSESLSSGKRNEFYIGKSRISHDLAKACLTYLNLDDFNEEMAPVSFNADCRRFFDQHPFIEYAARNWTYHLASKSKAELRNMYWPTLRAIFIDSRSKFNLLASISRMLLGDYKYPNGVEPIHVLAGAGLSDIASLLLEEEPHCISAITSDGRTALHIALENDQNGMVKLLVETSAPLMVTDIRGRSPLHTAVEMGNQSAFLLLVESGADVNSFDIEEQSPVTMAIENSWIDHEELLLHIAQRDVEFADGRSLLHLAAQSGAFIWVEALLKTHKDQLLNRTDQTGWTALHYAVNSEQEATAKALLIAGAIPDPADDKGWTPLHAAVKRKSLDCTRMLLEAMKSHSSILTSSPTLLDHDAAGTLAASRSFRNKTYPGVNPVVLVMAEKFSDRYGNKSTLWDPSSPHSKAPSPLLIAAWNADVEGFQLLIEYVKERILPNQPDGIGEMKACIEIASSGDTPKKRILESLLDIARPSQILLLLHRLGPARTGDLLRRRLGAADAYEDILRLAVENGDVSAVSWVLETWPPGQTELPKDILHSGIGESSRNILELLWQNGASLTALHRESHMTPLRAAAAKKDFEALEFLAQQKVVDILCGADKQTALHTLCRVQQSSYSETSLLDAVRHLLEGSSDPNMRNLERETALAIAVKHGSIGLVQILCNGGAVADAENLVEAASRGDEVIFNHFLQLFSQSEYIVAWKRAFWTAWSKRHIEVIRIILGEVSNDSRSRRPGERYSRDIFGDTKLHTAVRSIQINQVERLTSHTYSRSRELLEARDDEGFTPIVLAIHIENWEIAEILCGAGADYSPLKEWLLQRNRRGDLERLNAIVRQYQYPVY